MAHLSGLFFEGDDFVDSLVDIFLRYDQLDVPSRDGEVNLRQSLCFWKDLVRFLGIVFLRFEECAVRHRDRIGGSMRSGAI